MASQTADAWSGRVMKQPYTSRQGQFLAFIRHYTTLHGRPPAEAEMGQFFRLTPPSVHQMILALERRGLITREPGMARSIRLTLQPEQLPPLREAITMVPVSQIANQYDSGHQATMLRLGRIQIDDLFALNLQHPFDDSE
jgi:SOS-response transcriptional repressor LexA